MSDEAVVDDFDGDFDDPGPRKKLPGKKIVLFIILPFLLLGGTTGGIMFSGILGGSETDAKSAHAEPAAQEHKAAAPPVSANTVFYDLPEMVVNLNTRGRRPNFLKIKVSLELTSEGDIERVTAMRPRIIDNFQVYLRELRMDDLNGSAGIHRLREELLARVNTAVTPTRVADVLFKEVLVQ